MISAQPLYSLRFLIDYSVRANTRRRFAAVLTPKWVSNWPGSPLSTILTGPLFGSFYFGSPYMTAAQCVPQSGCFVLVTE